MISMTHDADVVKTFWGNSTINFTALLHEKTSAKSADARPWTNSMKIEYVYGFLLVCTI
ncbi:hypothetical protein [Peribacillus frigoritolerans]|uniref:hypothetical protein n=1 Tax=Peribacillus frigoritolerans TaxID=450367 RepID=UPI00227FEF21|nr:hypothetical protein [Peribacillus frigoritolerans]MCY9139851.1 hypothetical protein [Peribacillus frigoritolerans]